ncbi:BZIP transcription factor HacA [Aspergillus sclerotialis]|uniref:BZIP transcription factor HacA n=1 Tax=Aspergillus sclerotialis TaxID=2070753 RepID=A0A3A2ZMR5_9EURO|nr:BZIP transcription factor HacA [Aspergillus sclerotialis]
MEDALSSVDSLPATPASEMPPLTVSPADTSLGSPEVKTETKSEEKKPAKKRKSWGQELPVPKTNLPPRKRAKTDDEKEQRRIERVLRNRAAAQTSRERKRLEMEKLENEKVQMEQQNQFLLQRLMKMEAENNRLNRQVAQLSAEVRGSRTNSPKPGPPKMTSPTLTHTLFKQEGDDDLPLDRMRLPTPSATDYSPTLKPSTLVESSDVTQHPAAMLCDLQCPSQGSKGQEARYHSLNSNQAVNLYLQMMLQLLFLTMTSAAYSTVIHPLSQILLSLKMGSPLTFSTEEIYRNFPLIQWLISTPSLSPSKASSRPPVFRMRLLTRLLACSPTLARPLRDATGRELQLAVKEHLSKKTRSVAEAHEGRLDLESLLTLYWAIGRLERSECKRGISNNGSRSIHDARRKPCRSLRVLRSSNHGQIRRSRFMGKYI